MKKSPDPTAEEVIQWWWDILSRLRSSWLKTEAFIYGHLTAPVIFRVACKLKSKELEKKQKQIYSVKK